MYSIQDVSRKTGLSAHNLRYYEKEGLLSPVERTPGGFRQYSDEDLEALGLIWQSAPLFRHHSEIYMKERVFASEIDDLSACRSMKAMGFLACLGFLFLL
jgi:hypothetical protein